MPANFPAPSRPWLTALLISIALVASAALAGCGGNSSISATGGGQPATTQMVSTVGDTPMESILSAQATFSAVTLNPASGQSVSLLAAPRTVELSSLGGVREPLSLNPVPQGTYDSVTLTVTAASVTYLDTNNQVQIVNATLGGGGSAATATYSFPTPLQVNDSNGVDLRFDINLPQSFDLTGTTVTFTPTVTAAAMGIDKDSADDLYVRAAGIVTAISSSSITLTMFDSGASITFAINGQTYFDNNESAGSIQVGAAVWVRGQIVSGGTYTATEIEACDLGAKFGDQFNAAGAGRVIAVTQSNGQLSSFEMVTFTNFAAGEIGRAVTVNVNASTNYYLDHRAIKAGLTSFDATQIFAGRVVAYAGTSSDNGATVTALGVRAGAQTLDGSLLTVVSGSSPSFTFGLQPDALSLFELLTHATSVTIETNASTRFGGSLAASGMTGVTTTTPLEVRGFLQQSAGVDSSFATRVASN